MPRCLGVGGGQQGRCSLASRLLTKEHTSASALSRATPRPINRAQEEHRVGQLFSGLMMDITRQMPADPIQFMIDSLTLGPEQAVQVRAVRCLVPGFPSDDSSDGRCHLVLAHTRVAASYATCRVPRHPLSSLWRAEPGDGPAGAQAGAA